VGTAALQFVLETEPDELASVDNADALEKTALELAARSDKLRPQLWILGMLHPSSEVRKLAKELPNMLTRRISLGFSWA
jgi:hypothetical protein